MTARYAEGDGWLPIHACTERPHASVVLSTLEREQHGRVLAIFQASSQHTAMHATCVTCSCPPTMCPKTDDSSLGDTLQVARDIEKGLAAAVPGMSQATAQRRIEALEQALELETKRRHEEELRALLEGAPFVLHRGNDRTARHVWVADVPEKGGAMLRWQSNKGMSWTRSRAPRINLAKLPYHEASVSLLTSVTYGAAARMHGGHSTHRRAGHLSALQHVAVCPVWDARPGALPMRGHTTRRMAGGGQLTSCHTFAHVALVR